jgi:hypothetical protein
MAAFERSYKLIYKATITGNPTVINIDNVFDHTRSLYGIMFTQYYYNTGGTHDQKNLRRNGTTNTDSDNTRSTVVLQHSQSSAIYDGNTSNATFSTGGYAGSAATERGNTIMYYNPSNRGVLPSYYEEAIGFVNGTGFRAQANAGFKIDALMHDGMEIKNVGNQYVDGVLRVFKVDDQALYYKGQGIAVS